jgi:hypothetical protein
MLRGVDKQKFRFVGSYALDLGQTTSSTITFQNNLTGGLSNTPATNDIVIVLVGSSTSNINTNYGTSSSGWTEEADLYANATTSDANLGLFYKVMGSTPDTSITITSSNNIFIQSLTYVIRGVNITTPIDVTSTTATATGNANPNPPSITPNTFFAGVLGIGVGAGSGSVAAFTSSDLDNFVSAGSGFARLGIGIDYSWTGGAVDLAAFGGGQTNSAISWAAVSMALRPN